MMQRSVDLFPFVTGVGEATDLLRIAVVGGNIIESVDDSYDAIKAIKKLSTFDLTKNTQVNIKQTQFRKLVDDIALNGIQEPINYVKYSGKKYVVDGHHRLAAAKKLGIGKVPTIEVDLPYKGYAAYDVLIFDWWG